MNSILIQKYLQEYIDRFDEISDLEIYKWRAVKQFQDTWSKDFGHFKEKLEVALAETHNLLESVSYFPRKMIVNNAEKTPERIEKLFHELYDEEVDLNERITLFMEGMNQVNEENFLGKKHFQDHRAIIVYLALRYPDNYYLYKFGMFKSFAQKVDYHFTPKRGRLENINHFNYLCKYLNKEIKANDALLKLHYNRLDETIYADKNYHILTQDFVYAVSKYFEESDLKPENNMQKTTISTADISDYFNVPNKIVLQSRIVDFDEIHRRNQKTGKSGEQWVLELEIQKLKDWGEEGLSKQVKHVSVEQGDGIGYDILSFDKNGNELYIEVKTTKKGFNQPFYISPNELECSRLHAEKYRLYRVCQLDEKTNSAHLVVFSGSLQDWCTAPAAFKVNLNPRDQSLINGLPA